MDGGTFRAVFTGNVGSFRKGDTLSGRIVISSTHIATASVLLRGVQVGRVWAA